MRQFYLSLITLSLLTLTFSVTQTETASSGELNLLPELSEPRLGPYAEPNGG